MTSITRAVAILLLLGSACAAPRAAPPVEPPVAELPPAPEPEPPFPHPFVWTARAEVAIRTETRQIAVAHLFSRLEVLGNDSLGLHVRCSFCADSVPGWVSREDVVYEPLSPHLAAHRELAEFLLAVRHAAIVRDIEALRPVMVGNFVHSLDGSEGNLEALRRWIWEDYRSIDRLPALLDRGVTTRDGRVWAAPPEHLTDPGYRDLRAGFRRVGDRWEWLFLVRGY